MGRGNLLLQVLNDCLSARVDVEFLVDAGDMRAQILQVAENLRISLKAAGASFKDLVKTTTYVTAIDEFFKHPDARSAIFGESYPTSTTVEVRRLAQPELMVEIEVVAMVDE